MLTAQVRKTQEMQSKLKYHFIIERIKMRREYCFGNSSGGGTGC